MATMIPHTSENAEEKMTTVIADDLHIKGTITFATSLMIKGTLEGEIISEGLLVVGPTAKISATIVTKSLVSHGEIKGDVSASEQVVLKQTAVQTGNIATPYIVVENGSVFNGSCVMKREKTESRGFEEAPSGGAAQEIGEAGPTAEVSETAGRAGGAQGEQKSFDPPRYGQDQSNEPDEGLQPDAVKATGEAEDAGAARQGSGAPDAGHDQAGGEAGGAEEPEQKTKDDGGSEFTIRSKWRKKELF
ncbi:MAG: polymer-forming cytoskeletal protein [Syntrophorhabdales bacterium]|jgi:cytoskeletal protein CcmA (bactofilin family)